MSVRVSEAEAIARLSTLLDRVAGGDDVVICRGDRAIALITSPPSPGDGTRRPGSGKGVIVTREGWDEPLSDEEIRRFEESRLWPPTETRE